MKKESALNLSINILSFALSMGLSFWITPFIVHSLGEASYSFVPTTYQIVSYMSVITVSVTAISGRFFTISKTRGDQQTAQAYFSSTLAATLLLSAVLLIPLALSNLFLHQILNIPPALLSQVRLAHGIACAVFLVTFFTASFNIAPFAANKLYLTGSINIVQTVVRTFATFVVCVAFVPSIPLVMLCYLVAAVCMLALSVVVFKRLEPTVKITPRGATKTKEMLSSGMWASLSEIGVILFLQIDLFVANRTLSPFDAGQYAVVLQLPTLLRSFASAVTSIFTPVVVSLYAQKKITQTISYINRAVKYTGLLLSLPIGILCGLGATFLSLWIGPSYRSQQMILAVLTLHLAINLPVQIIMSIQTAQNKLKIPAFATVILGALNFAAAYVLAGPCKMGALGIAISGSVVLTLKNLVFTPLYAAHITNQPWYAYLPGILKPLFSTAAVAALCLYLQSALHIEHFFSFFGVCIVVSVIYFAAVWLFLLEKQERQSCLAFLKERVGK